ncbi:MAG: nucleotidyltransferase domain-containing protein [Micromonosporaceae bacterium]
MIDKTITAIAAFLDEIAQGRVVAAFVYGSVAAGTAKADSDIDCFVLLKARNDDTLARRLRAGFILLQTRLGFTPDVRYPVELFTPGDCQRALSGPQVARALRQATSGQPVDSHLAETDAVEVLRALLGPRLTVRASRDLDALTRQAQRVLASAVGPDADAGARMVLEALGVKHQPSSAKEDA